LDDEDIEAIISTSLIGLVISNQYFDFENIDQPVQTFMDRSFVFYMNPYMEIQSTLNVRRHNYKLNDNLFGINPSEENVFYSIVSNKEMNYYVGKDNYVYFMAEFTLDNRIDVYERTLRNSIDVFGDIGGIFEIIHLLLFLPIMYLSKRLFEYEISNHLSKFKSLLNEDEIEMDDLNKQNNLQDLQPTEKQLIVAKGYHELLKSYQKY
jgi:hypothetical protein